MIKTIFLILGIFLVSLLACRAVTNKQPKETDIIQTEKEEPNMDNNKMSIVEDWLAKRSLTLREITNKGATIANDVSYEKMPNLSRAKLNESTSMYYYFDVEGDCVMIYINDEKVLETLKTDAIINAYGEAEAIVASRVGKTASHYIYAQQGFAFSTKAGKIEFFEVFPSTTLEEYKEGIYEQPIFRK